MFPLGIRPDLSSEDKGVKRQLAKCLPRVYYELIRSDIPGPSGVNPLQGNELLVWATDPNQKEGYVQLFDMVAT